MAIVSHKHRLVTMAPTPRPTSPQTSPHLQYVTNHKQTQRGAQGALETVVQPCW